MLYMSDILSIHKEVLSILEDERKKNPQLYYKPRQRNNSNRLSRGYWFIGNDGYLMIGFAEGGDSKEKVHNVGFVIINNGTCWLEFSAQDSNAKANFLGGLAKKFSMYQNDKGKAKWYKEYKMPYKEALIYFINNDLPKINDAITNSARTGITLISEKKFTKYLEGINIFRTVSDKIARICWNDNDWKFPSGANGKSKTEGAYERDYGFGHEEWIFNPSRVIDGYHYSYLQPISTENNIHEGRIYNIHLYAINPRNEKCYVGVIKQAECITQGISSSIQSIYKSNGWLDEMKKEVDNVDGEGNVIAKSDPARFFNVRFKLSNLDIKQEMPLISNNDANTRGLHYVLMDKKGDFAFEQEPEDLISGSHNQKNTNHRYKTVNYSATIDPVHDKMQNNIVEILKGTGIYDANRIFTEHNRVDIKAQTLDGDWHFFEVKTDSAKISIRKALGQIMEYAHYPEVKKAIKLYVVSHHDITDADVKYLNYIRKTYNIPLWYRHYSFENNDLSNEY